MQISATGVLASAAPGTNRAVLTFPSVLALADGSLLATLRAGSTKDSADETIELYQSQDGGVSWQQLGILSHDQAIEGACGSLKVCYLSEIAPGRVLAAAMWIDRSSHPGKPLFNAETEGCLPMLILLAESTDRGRHWSQWRVIPMPADIGPASLTSPLIRLRDGVLAISIETNKAYYDTAPWMQRVVLFRSHDGGHSWGLPITAGEDPSGRIFNWDQRVGHAPDGRLGAFIWTYDSAAHAYLNIHRRISADGGRNWSKAEDLGFADQAGRPAVLRDGRVVLPWVDRFGTRTICVRLAADIAGQFDPASEVVLYALRTRGAEKHTDTTGTLLAEMGLWTFGLPFAEVLPNDEVLVVYYAGSEAAMDIHWTRIKIET